MKRKLAGEGFEVAVAENGAMAEKLVKEQRFDLVITDIIMPEQEGLETIIEFRKKFPDLKIIAMSGGGKSSAKDYLSWAKTLGADATIQKPYNFDELLKTITSLHCCPKYFRNRKAPRNATAQRRNGNHNSNEFEPLVPDQDHCHHPETKTLKIRLRIPFPSPQTL